MNLPPWAQYGLWIAVAIVGLAFAGYALQGSRLSGWLDTGSCHWDADQQETVCPDNGVPGR